MSLQSENRQQRNSLVDALVSANAQSVERLELTPYQPVVYAITQEWREEEFSLLQEAVKFQPEMYRRISLLATRKELEKYASELQNTENAYMQKAVANLKAANLETMNEIHSIVQQDGRSREKFISDCSSVLSDANRELETTITKLRRKILGIMIGTSVSAVVLSGLVSVLLWRLLG